jgi:peptidoglycan/xylan/chitin deacetylase (PgdA/CDA1 family)
VGGPLIGAAAAGAAFLAWAVRGRSSQVFGPTVWRGPRNVRAVALTFDDGPSDGTPELLDVLARYGVPATFFVCGMHVRRRREVLREIAARGHEIGNHTDTHARLWLRDRRFIRDEVSRAQDAIAELTGSVPRLFRPTYGVRWFGLREVQHEFGLTSVMWTVIGRDWVLPGDAVAARVVRRASNGAIFCLHDGREAHDAPDIRNTIDAVRTAVPRLLDSGFEFRTVPGLIG